MNKSEFWKENKEEIRKIVIELKKGEKTLVDECILAAIEEIAAEANYDIDMKTLKSSIHNIFSNEEEIEEADTVELVYSDDNKVDAIRQYRKEIDQYPLLTPEEEVELFRRYKNGEKELKDRLYTANLRLVFKMAKKYVGNGAELLDLIQEGNIGMLKAIDKFDVDLGYKFSTCARYWIIQAMQVYVRKVTHPYNIPTHAVDKMSIINKAMDRLYKEKGRNATYEELEKETGIDKKNIDLFLNRFQCSSSIFSTIGEDKDSMLVDFIPDENTRTVEDIVVDSTLHNELIHVMDILNDREKRIIIDYFGLNNGGNGKKLKPIAKEFGVTGEYIRASKQKALYKLRQRGKVLKLDNYLR